MKGVRKGGILRLATWLLAVAGVCDANAGSARGQLSMSLTIIDACTVSALDREAATDAPRGRASGPVHVACSGGAAPSVTFARVSRAMAFAAGIAPPVGEGVLHVEREAIGGDAVVRATVTF
jgi:hypothetical protein